MWRHENNPNTHLELKFKHDQTQSVVFYLLGVLYEKEICNKYMSLSILKYRKVYFPKCTFTYQVH